MATQMEELREEAKTGTLIERQTARFPSDAFLYAAGASIVGSLVLKSMRRDTDALFVGQWVPTFLLLGLYSKLTKHLGID